MLSTGTGNSTQLVIDITPPGESLNSAFVKINDNFANVWSAGPVNSNIQIANNSISTTTTNGNLILNPNGIGAIIANAAVIPDTANVRDIGSNTLRWRDLYVQYANVSGNIDITGDWSIAGNVSIAGYLKVTGNIIEVGNIITDSKTIQLANTAGNTSTANGSGITVGANDDIATWLYNSTANAWTTNIGLNMSGNASVGNLFIGNTLFTRTLTVARATTPVTVPLASNNSFNVLTSSGNVAVYTT